MEWTYTIPLCSKTTVGGRERAKQGRSQLLVSHSDFLQHWALQGIATGNEVSTECPRGITMATGRTLAPSHPLNPARISPLSTQYYVTRLPIHC